MRIQDIKDKLPHKGKYPRRDPKKITHIDIHHSASSTEDYEGFKTIKQFAYYHINEHGWPGIGYHYIVTPDESKEVFKAGYAREIRWSVGGHNSYTISVMVIGDYTEEEIEEHVYDKLIKVVKLIMKAYDVPVKNVMGHGEFPEQSTECPGIDMDKLRSDLND